MCWLAITRDPVMDCGNPPEKTGRFITPELIVNQQGFYVYKAIRLVQYIYHKP